MKQDIIRVRRIELIDETGTMRGTLEADSQGMSGLFVHDIGGTAMSASIGTDENGIPFLWLGQRDQGSVMARMNPDGPLVRLRDENGEEKVITI